MGLKFPASVSANGKAVLAYLPEEEARLIASKGLKRSTHAAGDALALEAFLQELELARRRGYSTDGQGTREGVHALGAPVFDATSSVGAGVFGVREHCVLGG